MSVFLLAPCGLGALVRIYFRRELLEEMRGERCMVCS